MNKKCINEEDIINYVSNRVSDKTRNKIEKHLAQCSKCIDKVILLNELNHNPDFSSFSSVPEHVTQKAISSVMALDNDTVFKKLSKIVKPHVPKISDRLLNRLSRISPIPQPYIVAVRNNKDTAYNDQQIGTVFFSHIHATIGVEEKGGDRVSIIINILKTKDKKNPIRISLFKNKREISSYLIDDSLAVFENISCGKYSLAFYQKSSNLGEHFFEIKK